MTHPIAIIAENNPKATEDENKTYGLIINDELRRLYKVEQQAMIIVNRINGGEPVTADHPSVIELTENAAG